MFRVLMLAALMVAFAAPMLAPHSAEACHNGVRHRVDPNVKLITSAEKAARRGDFAHAIKNLKRLDANAGANLHRRAMRTHALIVVRTKGAQGLPRRARLNKNLKHRDAAIDWAITTLRKQLGRTDNVTLRAHLAEGLALTADGAQEALDMLERLDNEGLIAEPQTYAALATLRRAQGNQAGTASALKKCRQIAVDTAICDAVIQADEG